MFSVNNLSFFKVFLFYFIKKATLHWIASSYNMDVMS